MLYLFSACLMFDLAGDSVYQGQPDPDPDPVIGVDGTEPQEPPEEPGQMGIFELEYSESEGFTEGSTIIVEVIEGRVDVVHTNVDLACDMSPYTPDLHMEDQKITIHYMPPTDERGCLMDVQFSIEYQWEEGSYTLQLMEDETEFVYE